MSRSFILFQFCAVIIVSEHNTSNDIWFIVLSITQQQIAKGIDLESATLQQIETDLHTL